MRNEFKGICYRCGQEVAPHQGHFERAGRPHFKKWGALFTSKWLTQHAECAIRFRGTDQHYKFNDQRAKGSDHE